MQRRITSLLLALLLLLSLLTGCQHPQENVQTEPSYTEAPTVETTAPAMDPTDSTDSTDPADPTEVTDPTDPTDPPATEPSATQPPATEPPATEPPATEPPATQPPATEPPATEPPATEPPATEPIPESDPYVGMTKAEFYADYHPATSYMDAYYRTQHFFLSGELEIPGQYAQEAEYRPMDGALYIRNTDNFYTDDGNTYIVVDSYGVEVMRIYKGAAYITLEEVAAYMYAFGGSNCVLPANYTSSKNTRPANSPWGEYLRVNHSYFSGDTSRYPYEPVLPNISGCGGQLQYFELDIGTTGTTTPGYAPKLYNNGSKIERGAARIVYARQDLNRNGLYEDNEVYVFYTHNHYNDFQEYLNYYGGWGEMFGNVTGGGEYSSKYNCNPTPYVPTAYEGFSRR